MERTNGTYRFSHRQDHGCYETMPPAVKRTDQTFRESFHAINKPGDKEASCSPSSITTCSSSSSSMSRDILIEVPVNVFIQLLHFNPEKREFETHPTIRIERPDSKSIQNESGIASEYARNNEKTKPRTSSIRGALTYLHPYYRELPLDTSMPSNNPQNHDNSHRYFRLAPDLDSTPLSLQSNDGHSSEILPRPSSVWWQAYHEWIREAFDQTSLPMASKCASIQTKRPPNRDHPRFETNNSLHDFNDFGERLVFWLRQEIALDQTGHSPKATFVVEPFRRLFSNVQLAPNPASWWHIQDMNYGYVIPSLQSLPISDELKCQLSQWRRRKSLDWTEATQRAAFQRHGSDLQQILTYELNVRPQERANSFIYNASRHNRRHSLFSI
jgi:hypothetical protein